MLKPFIKVQLAIFTALTVIALIVLALVYLRLPTYAGLGMYRLYAELPNSGGLYKTANVTFRGSTIGKVHSVSAVGEQFIDLTSPGAPNQYFSEGQTIMKGTVPAQVGPALDATYE